MFADVVLFVRKPPGLFFPYHVKEKNAGKNSEFFSLQYTESSEHSQESEIFLFAFFIDKDLLFCSILPFL